MSRLVIDGLYSKMMASSRGQKILPKPSFNMCMTMSTIQDQQHFPCHHQLCMLVICSLLSQNYEVNNKNILVQCKMLQFLYHVKKEKISLLQGTGRLEESLHVYKMSISPRVVAWEPFHVSSLYLATQDSVTLASATCHGQLMMTIC